jgi:hypothetical protein
MNSTLYPNVNQNLTRALNPYEIAFALQLLRKMEIALELTFQKSALGLIQEERWYQQWREWMKSIILRQVWNAEKNLFSPRFQEFVQQLIKSNN